MTLSTKAEALRPYILWLLHEYRCLWCNPNKHPGFDEPWIILRDNVPYINGEVAFHWQDTHGIDHEILPVIVQEVLTRTAERDMLGA